MESIIKVLAAITRVEDAVDTATADAVRAQLRELRKVCHEEYLRKRRALPSKESLEPTLTRVHDVPAPKGTPFERTFTSTYVGRLREEDSEG
jgi:hypothetical protein